MHVWAFYPVYGASPCLLDWFTGTYSYQWHHGHSCSLIFTRLHNKETIQTCFRSQQSSILPPTCQQDKSDQVLRNEWFMDHPATYSLCVGALRGDWCPWLRWEEQHILAGVLLCWMQSDKSVDKMDNCVLWGFSNIADWASQSHKHAV